LSQPEGAAVVTCIANRHTAPGGAAVAMKVEDTEAIAVETNAVLATTVDTVPGDAVGTVTVLAVMLTVPDVVRVVKAPGAGVISPIDVLFT